MLKTLFKKQMMELASFLFRGRKNTKRQSKGAKAGYAFLWVILFFVMLSLFWMIANQLCGALLGVDLDWFYFAIMGLISVALGVFGSVFSTYSSLYLAKDNEMLLSMPIPPSRILLSRLMGVYMMGLIYEAMVQIPTLIVYFINKGLAPVTMVTSVLLMFGVAFFILCLSCILGWVVALVSSKLKNRSFITVIISLVLIGAYYYFYMNMFQYLEELVLNSSQASQVLRSKGFLIYAYGMGASGNLLYFGIFLLFIVLCVAVVYTVLSRSYLRILMEKKGEAKKVYREKTMKKGSVRQALLWKEWKRFSTSAAYMLNCGLGIVFLLVVAVGVLIKGQEIVATVSWMFTGAEEIIPLIACAAACMCSSMNIMTAPSVSLEGKTIWIAQSIPVDAWDVLKAKLQLHLLLGMVPSLLCAAALAFALPMSLYAGILVILAAAIYTVFGAVIGLVLGLKMPNLDWINEMTVIKQGAAVMFDLFGQWVVVIVLGAGYAALCRALSPTAYLSLCMALILAVTAAMLLWLRKRGSRIFEEL